MRLIAKGCMRGEPRGAGSKKSQRGGFARPTQQHHPRPLPAAAAHCSACWSDSVHALYPACKCRESRLRLPACTPSLRLWRYELLGYYNLRRPTATTSRTVKHLAMSFPFDFTHSSSEYHDYEQPAETGDAPVRALLPRAANSTQSGSFTSV